MMDKIDTSTLGPIKVDPNKMGTRAKMVRDAIHSLSLNPALTRDERHAFGLVSYYAKNETLDLLGRMLK